MRISQSIAIGISLLVLGPRVAQGSRITCETVVTHQIGWCMDPDNEQDREDCSIEFFDWDTPEDGDCPNDDVSNPSGLMTDGF
jgi:hypothetical protein